MTHTGSDLRVSEEVPRPFKDLDFLDELVIGAGEEVDFLFFWIFVRTCGNQNLKKSV